MSFPLAVAPSVRTPGLALLVNLLAGQASPGSASLRCLLMCPKTSAGTITPDTQLVSGVAGPADVATYLGAGSPGHLASIAAFAEYGLLQMDLVAPTESAGVAATGTFTFANSPTTARTVTVGIAGRNVTISWLAGETAIQGATKLVTAINALNSSLPVSAGNGGGTLAVVTLTFVLKGPMGNDCTIRATVTDGGPTSATVTASGATLTGGTTEPDFTTALSTVKGTEYDFILGGVSNADAQSGGGSSNPGRIKTHITTYSTGFAAHLQQAIFGATGTLTAIKVGSAAMNYGQAEYIFCNNGESLPIEWGAAEMGARIRERLLDSASVRINLVYRAVLYGAFNLTVDALTDAQVEDALQSGVTPVTYNSSSAPRPSRPITTYFKDSGGASDNRLLDVSRVDGIFDVAKDIRTALPREFPQAKLSDDLQPGVDENPPGVVEVRDVKQFIIVRIFRWVKLGVVQGPAFRQAIADGTFIVRVDPGDTSQCDIVLPLKIVPPLAKFSLVVNHVGP